MHHFIALILGLNQGWKAQPVEFSNINIGVLVKKGYCNSKAVNRTAFFKITGRGRAGLMGKQLPMGEHNFLSYLADSDHVLVRHDEFADGTTR